MWFYLSTKEFWLTTGAAIATLTMLWKGLKLLVAEVRALVTRVAYIQGCLQKYGPTLIEIAEAFHGDTGKSLIDSVKHIEVLSESIKQITVQMQNSSEKTVSEFRKASDRNIDTLQTGVLKLQKDMEVLTKALIKISSDTAK